MISKFGKEALTKFAVPLTKDILPELATKTTLFCNRLISERKIRGRGATRAGSGLLIDGVTETLKDEIKNQEGGVLASLMAPMAASLIWPLTSSLLGGTFEKGISEIEKRQEHKILPLLASILFKGIFGKGVTTAGKGYNYMGHMNKYF